MWAVSSCYKNMSSNPFQGFGGVSAGEQLYLSPQRLFPVSIPFRVLVGFLRIKFRAAKASFPRSFNPFQGFGGVSALVHPSSSLAQYFAVFQSLSGFWWGFCRKLEEARASGLSQKFQSLSGFWWGFCTSSVNIAPGSHIPFQSLSGFWWGFC